MKLAFKLALCVLFSLPLASAQVVQTAQGKVSGMKAPDSTVSVFKGIPFAAPPVGDLRWHAPLPPASWQGTRKATEFAASCMQTKSGERLPWSKEFMTQNQISEDCLYLNIWTPQASAAANLPVIVFIHGGGYSEGSGAIDVYDGAHLAPKGAVVVTINYRLGVFGFLADSELTAESEHHSSGNYGLLDQIEALKWVNKNIAGFGGNPRNITIWGQSAGAFSVAALVASPLAKGLFEQAQADSGIGIAGLPTSSLSAAEAEGVKLLAEHHAASIKELRALPAEALMPDPKAPPAAALRFAPDVDGWVLPDLPGVMNAKGTDNDVPMITGYNTGDSSLMAFGPVIDTVEAYRHMAETKYGAMAEDFLKVYPAASADQVKSMLALSGQDRNRVSQYMWASQRVKSHHAPVYIYYFDRAIPWPQHPEFGAFHTSEIPYFFENLKVLDRPWEKVDFALSDEVSSYLVNFAAKGDPNAAGLTPWPKADLSTPQTMELGAHSGAIPLADPVRVDFWTRYFNSPASKNASPF